MTQEPDRYFEVGCGRCKFGGTSACKALQFAPVLAELRTIAQDTGLKEVAKWGVPCYMLEGKNVFLLSAFKTHVAFSFFQGSLMKDHCNRLEKPGAHSQATRLLKFYTLAQVHADEALIQRYLQEAVSIAASGEKVSFGAREKWEYPEELQDKFTDFPALEAAFAALTPGRKRSHILHISGGKRTETRKNRVEKCVPKILAGKGFNER